MLKSKIINAVSNITSPKYFQEPTKLGDRLTLRVC